MFATAGLSELSVRDLLFMVAVMVVLPLAGVAVIYFLITFGYKACSKGRHGNRKSKES